MMETLFTSENLIALTTLTALEIVLGIDNVIFISILAAKLPADQRALGRRLGIGLAVLTRVLLLLMISWIVTLTFPLFHLLDHGFSGRDLILLGGGLFLIGKSTFEIHEKLEGAEQKAYRVRKKNVTLLAVAVQIAIVDIVFSLDSVITAVGISGRLVVMIPAIMVAALVMLISANAVAHFVERHPTMKILALSFLILIGALLVIEGWDPALAHNYHLKNYAYFAMAFSFLVELANMRLRRPSNPVRLRNLPSVDSQLKLEFDEKQ